ncbi:MAG TPA: MOSC domain-containing protein [Caulobacteraceae bacterium]
MTGVIAALFRHPIKGFSPEKLGRERLTPGEPFPNDRLFAVENGPSGFDPAAPGFIPKQRFAVLASIADVAKIRTRFDPASGKLRALARGGGTFEANLRSAEGKQAFAEWLEPILDTAAGPLKVIDGVGHAFLDHPLGHISILNLASLRDLEMRIGQRLDPGRLRANLHVEGWPAWIENGWSGRQLALGAARVRVFAPISRCAAPGVDPQTALRDVDFTAELHRHYGHVLCGVYVQVEHGAVVAQGDAADALPG